jgi:hypothetical protein
MLVNNTRRVSSLLGKNDEQIFYFFFMSLLFNLNRPPCKSPSTSAEHSPKRKPGTGKKKTFAVASFFLPNPTPNSPSSGGKKNKKGTGSGESLAPRRSRIVSGAHVRSGVPRPPRLSCDDHPSNRYHSPLPLLSLPAAPWNPLSDLDLDLTSLLPVAIRLAVTLIRGGGSAGAGRMTGSMDLPAKGGFSFDLCRRNNMLEKNGLKVPGFRKTGTTIVGLVFQVRPPTRCVDFWCPGNLVRLLLVQSYPCARIWSA